MAAWSRRPPCRHMQHDQRTSASIHAWQQPNNSHAWSRTAAINFHSTRAGVATLARWSRASMCRQVHQSRCHSASGACSSGCAWQPEPQGGSSSTVLQPHKGSWCRCLPRNTPFTPFAHAATTGLRNTRHHPHPHHPYRRHPRQVSRPAAAAHSHQQGRIPADVPADVPPVLLVPGLYRPSDLLLVADEALERCMALQFGALLAADAGLAGPTFVRLLLELEVTAADIIRPARYLQEWHLDPQWVQAAEEAKGKLQRLLKATWTQPLIHTTLEKCERELQALAGAEGPAGGEGAAGPQGGSVGESVDGWLGVCRHLLRQCRGSGGIAGVSIAGGGTAVARCEGSSGDEGSSSTDLLSVVDDAGKDKKGGAFSGGESGAPRAGNGSNGDDSNSGSDSSGGSGGSKSRGRTASHAERLRKCQAAFRALASDPALSPALMLHPDQAAALRPWLGAFDADDVGARTDVARSASGSWSEGPPPLPGDGSRSGPRAGVDGRPESEELTCAADGAGRPADARSAKQREGQLPASFHLHDGYSLELGEAVMLDWSLEAEELEGEGGEAEEEAGEAGHGGRRGGGGAGEAPVMARLPWEVVAPLLQGHPDEGVRWQVYRSGLIKRQGLLLQALDELAALRNRTRSGAGAGTGDHTQGQLQQSRSAAGEPSPAAGSGHNSVNLVNSAPHSVNPVNGAPHSVNPVNGAPHSVNPDSGTPHSTRPTSSDPHGTSPAGGDPHSVNADNGTPHNISPAGNGAHSVSSAPGDGTEEGFAALMLEGSLAGTPSAAAALLRRMAAELRPLAVADVEGLKGLARRVGVTLNEGPGSSSNGTGNSGSGSSGNSSGSRSGGSSSSGTGTGGSSDSRGDTGTGASGCSGNRVEAGRLPTGSSLATPPGSTPGPTPRPTLDGWHVDHLLMLAAREARGRLRNLDWEDFEDYYNLGSVLQGVNDVFRRCLGVGFRRPHLDEEQEAALAAAWGLEGDVLVLQAIDERRGPLGTLLLHLHQDTSDFPFTTLIRHGPLWPGDHPPGPRSDADCWWVGGPFADRHVVLVRLQSPDVTAGGDGAGSTQQQQRQEQQKQRRGQGQRWGQGQEGPTSGRGGGHGARAGPGVAAAVTDALSRRVCDPAFLRVLLHELGHAMHYLCSGPDASGAPRGRSDRLEEAVEAEGDRWTVPLPSAPRLSASLCPADVREIPSHVFERWARQPQVLQAMSCHQRTGRQLSDRDAGRLAHLLSSYPYSNCLELHDAVLAALADLYIHGAPRPAGAAGGGGGSGGGGSSGGGSDSDGGGSGGGGDDDGGGGSCRAASIWQEVWERYGVMPGVEATLGRVQQLESLGAVGGVKYAYIYCKLLAAAAWKVHFSQDPLNPDAGRRLKHLLLESGGQDDPASIVQRLLGSQALLQAHGGWLPNLRSEVYQDIELLG